jgi:hypothetical protein
VHAEARASQRNPADRPIDLGAIPYRMSITNPNPTTMITGRRNTQR